VPSARKSACERVSHDRLRACRFTVTPVLLSSGWQTHLSSDAEKLQRPGKGSILRPKPPDARPRQGPKGKHDSSRGATRHGCEQGSVVLGGRKVTVTRPRARHLDGSGEVELATYKHFNTEDLFGEMALERNASSHTQASRALQT
jgi:hypothetical protein